MSERKVAIAVRRRKVAELLSKSMTEEEIAQTLGGGISQSTVSRDIQALREESQNFVHSLAKSDLAFYFKQCIDGIADVKQKALELYASDFLKPKDKLLALRLVIEAEQARFSMLKEGPLVMAFKAIDEKVNRIQQQKEEEAEGI
jgi:hypothetical protein